MKKQSMKPKERVFSKINGQETDYLPVINPVSNITLDCMEISNTYFPEAHTDFEKMAKLASTGYEILGFDTISPYFSVQQEAAVFGSVDWGNRDKMPYMKEVPYNFSDDIEIPSDFLDKKPIKTVLNSIRLLKRYYKNEVCIIGKVMGPWTLAYHLYGIEDFLIKTITDPKIINEVLDSLKEISIIFGEAQFEMGIDLLTVADHATGDLISPDSYRKFLKPVHKEINERIHGLTILHICGNTLDRMKDFAEAGFDVFHFESKNASEEAKKQVGTSIKLTGNINNPEIILNGTPEQVRENVFKTAKAGIELISPECAVPLKAPIKNLISIVEASKDFSGIYF